MAPKQKDISALGIVQAKQQRAAEFRAWQGVLEGVEGAKLNAAEQRECDEHKGRMDALDAHIADLEAVKAQAGNGGGRVRDFARALGETRTEGVYRDPRDADAHRGQPGYFHDMWLAKVGADGATEARERLTANHNQWLAEVEHRAGITTDASHAGSDFAPALWQAPQYDYVQLLRNGRPFLNWYGPQELPLGVSPQLLLPTVTGGATVTEMGSEGSAVSNTDPVTATDTISVGTLSGYSKASVQMLELGPVGDKWIVNDLQSAYDTKAEDVSINGAATNRKGLSQVAGTSTLTSTALSIFDIVLQAATKISRGAPGLKADFLLTTPEFWQSFLASVNGTTNGDGRPDFATGEGQAYNVRASLTENPAGLGHVGSIFGVPVIVSNAVNNDLVGDDTYQSGIYVASRAAFNYLESAPRIRVADQVNIANLQVTFLMYGYAAQVAPYPKGIVKVTGTGNIPSAGFQTDLD